MQEGRTCVNDTALVVHVTCRTWLHTRLSSGTGIASRSALYKSRTLRFVGPEYETDMGPIRTSVRKIVRWLRNVTIVFVEDLQHAKLIPAPYFVCHCYICYQDLHSR